MPDLDDRIDKLEGELNRTRWLGPLYGSLPQMPVREELPAATEDFAYRMVVIAGEPSVAYICLQDNTGTWEWAEVATGTP